MHKDPHASDEFLKDNYFGNSLYECSTSGIFFNSSIDIIIININ